MKRKFLLAAALAAAFSVSSVQAQTEIHWWHSMGGGLGDWVNDMKLHIKQQPN